MTPKPLNFCFAIIRWAPVVFITAVVVWSYYAYVIQMCMFTVENVPEKVIYLLCYHPILFIFMWTYARTIFTLPGEVPKEFYLSRNDGERFEQEENEDVQREILARAARSLPVQNRTASGCIRYCEKCKCIKPDRAHHCSVCGQCVLKMDHHCPWVNNCVCFTNYKFFVLFLGYAFIYCIYVSATSLQYFIKFWTRADSPSSTSSPDQGGASATDGMGKFHILFMFFAALMFAISLISLFGYHCYLVSQNRSTLVLRMRSVGSKDNRTLHDSNLSNLHILFLFFAAIMFSVSVVSLLGFHLWLISKNRSTLESFRAPIFRSGPDKDGFSLGRQGNFMEIFGDDKKLWFLPVFSSVGDGVNYPTRVAQPAATYSSMDNTAPSAVVVTLPSDPSIDTRPNPAGLDYSHIGFGDGVTYPIRTVDEDYDSLLGQRQRWAEEGEVDGGPGCDNTGMRSEPM